MRRTLGLVVVTAALLTGCGNQTDSGGQSTGTSTAPSAGGGGLAAVTGEKLCGMVSRTTVEQQFHDPVRDAQGGRESQEKRESISCTYVTESMLNADTASTAKALSVSTNLRAADAKATTAKAALDAYFVDDKGKTVAYTPVEGLGAAAGYAGSDLKVRLGGNHLVSILPHDGEFVEVITKSEPAGSLDQLRPIARELADGARAALG